ncbi:4880_t:CDS:2 [Diversispora eburnea]|uniref:4880_t:CDS:1 n=1 Tax=Diversispora eburnea TaxID=1213867 RepID=A0A9N9CLP0_9GLOM|nr:4880_t:CDS:2 [Diversispora eburnea]
MQKVQQLCSSTRSLYQAYNIGHYISETITFDCHNLDDIYIYSCYNVRFFSTKTQGTCCGDYNVRKDFHANIRAYNSIFAFTSIGVRLDENLANSKNGVYMFRIQEGIYHSVRSLLPVDKISRFFQLYIYNIKFKTTNRLAIMPQLCQNILEIIKSLLNNLYLFVTNFYLIFSVSDITKLCLFIRTDHGLDQLVYSVPTALQVAAVLIEENKPTEYTECDIIVQS